MDSFKKVHEKDISRLANQIDGYEARIETQQKSIKGLEDDLRKCKIDLEGEIRVKMNYEYLFQ